MRAASLVLAVGLACGCSVQLGGLKVAVGPGSSEPSWSGGSSASSVCRGDACVHYAIEYLTRDDKHYFVLVAEGVRGGKSGTGSDAGGTLRSTDGRDVPWTCQSVDGKIGVVTIGGERFDLAKGGLFLVTARDGKTYARQSTASLENFQGAVTLERLRSWAASDPPAAEFFDRLDPKPGS